MDNHSSEMIYKPTDVKGGFYVDFLRGKSLKEISGATKTRPNLTKVIPKLLYCFLV